jgi:hypothetical protein
MKTKKRIIQNYITTIFGSVVMFGALVMLVINRLPNTGVDFSLFEMILTALFGWIFVMAKDSLIEGLFMGVFKVKEK